MPPGDTDGADEDRPLDEGSPKKNDPPANADGSQLKAILHRVDGHTGRFVRKTSEDRQNYFAFYAKQD